MNAFRPDAYWLFNVLGAAAATIWFWHRAKAHGLATLLACDAILVAFPLAVLGGHLLAVLLDSPRSSDRSTLIATLPGWLVAYTSFGAVLGAGAGLTLVSRMHRIRFAALADLAGPGLLIAAALGRIGCFVRGCCYGKTCSGSTCAAIATLVGSVFDRQPRHPVPLYETTLHVVALVTILRLARKRQERFGVGRGTLAATCLASYCAVRLALEAFRAPETSPALVAGLSFTEWAGAFGLVLTGFFLAWSARTPTGALLAESPNHCR
jgi:phosphatidylglycerol:prolipoprotein diacylglycerol transferase